MTVVLLVTAGAGLWLVYKSTSEPMWHPRLTPETVEDLPDESQRSARLTWLVADFGITAIIVTAAGAVVAHTTGNILERTGMNETVAGGLSAVVTSLPELVTTVAAVE